MIDRFTGRYHFLSNFYRRAFLMGGVVWPSAEHAYQAMKCADTEDVVRVRTARSPGQAKAIGRRVRIRPHWDAIRVGMMHLVLRAKFEDEEMARRLVATDPEELVEGNDWGDTFWGRVDGVGENHLGRQLMVIREGLVNARGR